MRRPPRKPFSAEQLYAAALRALVRRAHSEHEMRQVLEPRAGDETAVERVLGRLKQEKLLDDARYAREFARYRAESRHQGRFRIARELRARGVAGPHVEAALQEVLGETAEAILVREQLERKLGRSRHSGTAHARGQKGTVARLYRSLLRAGFSADIIRSELRALMRQDLPEPPEPPPTEDD